jgi:hypothetical protein
MDADFRRINPRESAFIGGYIPLSVTDACRRIIERVVIFVANQVELEEVFHVERT